MLIDEMLEKPYYIIDVLPFQVPRESNGDFFEVEGFLLNNYKRFGLREKYIGIILKLMCYYKITVEWDGCDDHPTPEQIVEIIDAIMENFSGDVNIVIPEKDVLIQFGWDCLNMTVYNPDEEVCSLMEQLAFSEGMFWRKGV